MTEHSAVTLGDKGTFFFLDSNWETRTTYRLILEFKNTSGPMLLNLRASAAGPTYMVVSADFEMPSTYQDVGFAVNAAQDSTSTQGHVASIWTSAMHAAMHIEAEGETRHKFALGTTTPMDDYDIVFPGQGTNSNCNCGSERIEILTSRARSSGVAHEFGHALHGRVVGCSGIAPEFPLYTSLSHSFRGGEGTGWTEALADVVRILAFRDPATVGPLPDNSLNWDGGDCELDRETGLSCTSFADCTNNLDSCSNSKCLGTEFPCTVNSDCVPAVCNTGLGRCQRSGVSLSPILPCDDNSDCFPPYDCLSGGCLWSRDHYNDGASERNLQFVLWEYLDTNTSGSDNSRSDGVDVTLKQLYDGLRRWHADDPPGSDPRANRSNAEFHLTPTGKKCGSGRNEQCEPGQVCLAQICQAGDPHGGNVRDFAAHLAAEMGDPETAYWETIISSPCFGLTDDVHPYEGGYQFQ